MSVRGNEEQEDAEEFKRQERIFDLCGCTTCPGKDNCQLKDVITYLDMDLSAFRISEREIPLENGDPFFDRDYDLCILCGRCVRVCHDIRGNGAISLINRGSKARVGTAFGEGHLEGPCMFCGACVDVCPTGALSIKERRYYGQADRTVKSTCSLCGLGCSMDLMVKWKRVVDAEPNIEGWNKGQGCVLGRFCLPQMDRIAPRLKTPLIRKEGVLVPVGWDEAIEETCSRLAEFNPGDIGFIFSRDLTNESSELLGRISIKGFPGSSRYLDSPLAELMQRYYFKIPTNSVSAQFQFADKTQKDGMILIVGGRPDLTHGQLMADLKRAKNNGTAIVYVGLHPYVNTGKETINIDSRQYSVVLLSILNNMIKVKVEGEDFDLDSDVDSQGELNRLSSFLDGHLNGSDTGSFDEISTILEKCADNITIFMGVDILNEEKEGDPALTITAAMDILELSGNSGSLLFLLEGNSRGVIENIVLQDADDFGSGDVAGKKVIFTTAMDAEIPDSAELVILQNPFEGKLTDMSDIILPAASLTETHGTMTTLYGKKAVINEAGQAPGTAMQDKWIFDRIIAKLGIELELHSGEKVDNDQQNIEETGKERGSFKSLVLQKLAEYPDHKFDVRIVRSEPFTFRGIKIQNILQDLEVFLNHRMNPKGGD